MVSQASTLTHLYLHTEVSMGLELSPAQKRFQQIKAQERTKAIRDNGIAEKIKARNQNIDASLLARIVEWRKERGLR